VTTVERITSAILALRRIKDNAPVRQYKDLDHAMATLATAQVEIAELKRRLALAENAPAWITDSQD